MIIFFILLSVGGNVINSISDHLAPIIGIPNSLHNHSHKPKVFKINFTKTDWELFTLDLPEIDWDKHIKTEKQDVNYLLAEFFKILETLLDRHAPYKEKKLKAGHHKLNPG